MNDRVLQASMAVGWVALFVGAAKAMASVNVDDFDPGQHGVGTDAD